MRPGGLIAYDEVMRVRCIWVSLLLLSLDPSPAWSIGACEGTETVYTLSTVAEAAGLLAYDVKIGWCQVKDDGDEEEGTLKAVLVTDLKTRAKTWFVTAKSSGEKSGLPSGSRRANAEWPAFAKEKGFRPVQELALGAASAPGSCAAEVVAIEGRGGASKAVPLAQAKRKNDFTRLTLGLRIRTAAGELPMVKLGRHSIGAGPPDVFAVPLPSLGIVRVFLVTAECGGPPPGYFDKDDPGSCYANWTRRHVDLARPASAGPMQGIEKCISVPPQAASGADASKVK